ncbi:MAG: hypothetical protein AAGB19_14240, partial [Cyanobacteria bacterium P01_F01_bin.3]
GTDYRYSGVNHAPLPWSPTLASLLCGLSMLRTANDGLFQSDEWSPSGPSIIEIDGTEGLQPPDWVKQLDEKSTEYQTYTLVTPESDQLGSEIVDLVQSDLLFLGTIGNPAEPVYHRNDLGNFKGFTAKSYDY